MKADEITCGYHKVGGFTVGIQRCCFDGRPLDDAEFFEVFVMETMTRFYVHLADDLRFAWWAWLPGFERRMIPEDLVEYNSYALRRKLVMPTWRLSRHSVVKLVAMCLKLKVKG